MDSEIREVLLGVRQGTVSIDQALLTLKQKPFEDLGYAKVDLHRKLRQGAGEVIYGEGKTGEQIVGILTGMLENGQKNVLITRLRAEKAAFVQKSHPIFYDPASRIGILGEKAKPWGMGNIVIATGGTTEAIVGLIEQLGGKVVKLCFVMELAGLKGRERLAGYDVESAITYEGK